MWDSAKNHVIKNYAIKYLFVKEIHFHDNDISSYLKKPEEENKKNKENNKDLKWTKMVLKNKTNPNKNKNT